MSFIPKAKLWLPVRRNAEVMDLTSSNGNELWENQRLIVQRIQPGDTMILWPGVDDLHYDAADGPQWPVKEVFWDADGAMQIELALMILNPSNAVRAAFTDQVRGGWDVDMFSSKRLWTTEEGSDFDADMESGGWLK
jgi:hypothetical protein